MGSIRAWASAVGLAVSSAALGGDGVVPLQLFGIEGRYERTANGDILLYPSTDVSVLRDAPLTFALVPSRGGAGPFPVLALPGVTRAGAEDELDAPPVPGPFRGGRYRFSPRALPPAWGSGRPPAWLEGAYPDRPPGWVQGW